VNSIEKDRLLLKKANDALKRALASQNHNISLHTKPDFSYVFETDGSITRRDEVDRIDTHNNSVMSNFMSQSVGDDKVFTPQSLGPLTNPKSQRNRI
jgi:hypothetical protein